MIDAKELRIGNIVAEFGLPIVITADHIKRIDDIQKAGKKVIDLSFMPLTEDWLKGFGCISQKISSLHKNYWNKDLDFSIDVEFTFDKDVLFFYRICEGKRRVPLRSVHHLQNLYFALTGKELKL